MKFDPLQTKEEKYSNIMKNKSGGGSNSPPQIFLENNISLEHDKEKTYNKYIVREFADNLYKNNKDKDKDKDLDITRIYDELTNFIEKFIFINYDGTEYPTGELYQQFSVFTNLFFSLLNAFTDYDIDADGLISENHYYKPSYLIHFLADKFPKHPMIISPVRIGKM